MRLANRNIKYKGMVFYLNDNHNNNEFSCKYNLLVYKDRWIKIAGVDSKKQAMEYIKENYLYI